MAKRNANPVTGRVTCKNKGCRHRTQKKRRVCDRCRKRIERDKFPIKGQWCRLRDKAKQRNITFCLPYWYFEHFALQCDYANQTGNEKQSLTVDRKNNLLGYVVGNIQPLSREANIDKQYKSDMKRYEAGFKWRNK
jgi:hypothetical protein